MMSQACQPECSRVSHRPSQGTLVHPSRADASACQCVAKRPHRDLGWAPAAANLKPEFKFNIDLEFKLAAAAPASGCST
jgi:hypothetical protein